MEPITLTLMPEPIWFLWGWLILSYILSIPLARQVYRETGDKDTVAVLLMFAPITIPVGIVFGIGWLLMKLVLFGCHPHDK